MTFEIHTGTWTDWSRGRILGATITLSSRDASLLLAFIAAFVTILAIRLWVIISFAAHQFLATGGKHDGLYYQRQVILRNAKSAPAAAWLFLQQSWYWRGIARSAIFRTLPLAVFCILYFVGFALLAVFSSQISDSASEFRLLRSPSCGFQLPINREALQEKSTFDNLRASIYSRECYHDGASGLCNSLPVSRIPWTNTSVDCPFEKRICVDTPAFRMGTDFIDSHRDFGFNDSPNNRIRYRRETICSPLITTPGFAEEEDTSDGGLIKYFYGTNLREKLNHTFIYPKFGQRMEFGYSAWTYYYPSVPEYDVWRPTEELNLPNRDISLMAIAPNGIHYTEKNNDPVFAATNPHNGGFRAYRYVSPIACVDGHQICNPNNDECTPLLGSRDAVESAKTARLDLNYAQFVAVQRLRFVIEESTFYHAIWTRTQNFLRAQEKVAGITGQPLPSNQWEIEMAALFDDTLASLQYKMIEYAAGSSAPGSMEILKPWENATASDKYAAPYRNMCFNQRTKETQGTLNFSVVGLSLLLGLGTYVILVSFILEFTMLWIQQWLGRGVRRAKRWERDGTLQQMRLLYEIQGDGIWNGTTEDFPRTTSGDVFEHDRELWQ